MAQRLRGALGAENEVAAVNAIVRLTFNNMRTDATVLRTLIADYEDRTAAQVAASLNLSMRQYFRYRAEAFEAIAHVLETVLSPENRKAG